MTVSFNAKLKPIKEIMVELNMQSAPLTVLYHLQNNCRSVGEKEHPMEYSVPPPHLFGGTSITDP